MYEKHEGGLLYRDWKDISVIKEQSTCYRQLADNPVEGLYLDLGGYIGTFAWFALNKLTPTKVVSVEPFPSSVDVLEANFGDDPRVDIRRAAVAMESGTTELYLGKTYSSCNSTMKIRGREVLEVDTVAFGDLLALDPVLIKCDIEGGEYSLDWDDLPYSVRSLAFEFHHAKKGWLDQQVEVDQQLLDQGFQHVRAPQHKQTYQGVTIAIYWRPDNYLI